MKRLFVTVVLVSIGILATAQTKKYAVVKTDAEWKKQLTKEQFSITRKKEQKLPTRANIGITTQKEFMLAFVVAKSYLVVHINLIVVLVGQVFINLL